MPKRYDKQFRQQAIKLVTEQERDPTTVARDLGMPHTTLFQWLHKIGWSKPPATRRAVPLCDDPAVLKTRICQLEAQVQQLETDREILKKAAAFFANQNR